MSTKKFVNEERCSVIFEKIFDQKRDGERLQFKKVRPWWLVNHETGYCLELEGYCKQLKLAFEYDGIQHYEYPNPFHRSEREFLQQRKRDQMENRKCKICGVTLIRIRYDERDLEGYIRKELRKR